MIFKPYFSGLFSRLRNPKSTTSSKRQQLFIYRENRSWTTALSAITN